MDTKYVYEQVYVETPVDTDGDGRLDRIRVFIKRQRGAVNIPAVYVANPYLLHCNEDWYDLKDVNVDLKAYDNQSINWEDIRFDFSSDRIPSTIASCTPVSVVESNELPEYTDFECISPLYDSLVDKGYAAVYSGGLGTRGSDGFVLSGSREEILAFKSVIDWLNGRATAFTAKDSDVAVTAEWCSGNVAMSGKSYLGTMCIGVAATGVSGLKTIIPEAGIANWYDYYRTNGLVCPPLEWQGDDIDILSKYCLSRTFDTEDYDAIKDSYELKLLEMRIAADRDSGNYNKFWDERNYFNQLDNYNGSALIISGLNDFNVKPTHAVNLFKALEEKDAERKMLLHRGEHIYIYNLEGSPTLEIIEKWLDHYLKGIDNGIENEAKLIIEDDIDQLAWRERDTWDTGNGLVITSSDKEDLVFTDDIAKSFDSSTCNYEAWRRALILDDNDNAVRYEYPLADDLVISGDIEISFEAKIDQPTAIFSAMLVDLGSRTRLTGKVDGEIYEGFSFQTEESPSDYRIITRGHLNAQNRTTLYSKEAIDIDKFYKYSFKMIPMDYTVKAGNTLALIVYGVDPEQTVVSKVVTRVTIRQESLRCVIGTL